MNLSGKTVIVTGGARDIGRAILQKLARQGANVVVNYFNKEQDGLDTVAAIKAAGGNAIAVKADVTKKANCDNMVAQAQKAFGKEVHVLVNNAGGLVARKKLEEMDEAFWDLLMDLNLKSIFLMRKSTVQFMPKRSSIINLASQAGRDGGGGGASAYATAKGAVMTFTRAMAKELGPKGIRVNALCPGMIDTTFHDTFTSNEIRTIVAGKVPLRREGMAAEVADLVSYLANDSSSYVSGTNIDINGGLAFS